MENWMFQERHASYGHSAISDLLGALEKPHNILKKQYRPQNALVNSEQQANLDLLFNLAFWMLSRENNYS